MKTYILKVYAVIPGAPRHDYEADGKVERFRSLVDAEIYGEWWKFDQGRKDTMIADDFIECPMIGETVFVPDSIL
jgi:hypothetical protein